MSTTDPRLEPIAKRAKIAMTQEEPVLSPMIALDRKAAKRQLELSRRQRTHMAMVNELEDEDDGEGDTGEPQQSIK